MDNTSKLLRKPDLVWREVDGEVVVLSADNKHLEVFNDIGSRIWTLLNGERDVASIVAILCKEYEEQADRVEKDTIEHLEHLKRLNLVEE